MAALLSLPDEVILRIIYTTPLIQVVYIYDLRALFATCKQINRIMVAHRSEIKEHFTTIEACDGGTCHSLAGLLHRENDLPAVVTIHKWTESCLRDVGGQMQITTISKCETQQFWYIYGKAHRYNGPAYIREAEGKPQKHQWWTRGKLILEKIWVISH